MGVVSLVPVGLIAVIACKPTPKPRDETGPSTIAVAVDAAAVDVDAAVAPPLIVSQVPAKPELHDAESWVLVRREDQMTAFACTTSVDGKVSIHRASECKPLTDAELAVVDAKGTSVMLRRSSETLSCRAAGWDNFDDLVAYAVTKGKLPAIVFYPRSRAPKLLALTKRWAPTQRQRRLLMKDHDGSSLDPVGIGNLDRDPALERLAIVATKHATGVGHGQTARTIDTRSERLLLDNGDGELEAITDLGGPMDNFEVSIAAVTDLDGDGFHELWIEATHYKRVWYLHEVSSEDGFGFVEDCKAG